MLGKFDSEFRGTLADIRRHWDCALHLVSEPADSVTSELGLVSRVTPVHTAVRNCTRDEGGPFEVGNQVLISSHRKLLSSKAMVVSGARDEARLIAKASRPARASGPCTLIFEGDRAFRGPQNPGKAGHET